MNKVFVYAFLLFYSFSVEVKFKFQKLKFKSFDMLDRIANEVVKIQLAKLFSNLPWASAEGAGGRGVPLDFHK